MKLACVLAAAGILLVYLALTGERSTTIPLPAKTTMSKPEQQAGTKSHALPGSQPDSIRIPSLNVSSDLVTVGLQADGSPAVPEGTDIDKAAWLTSSVTPGEIGTSVIVGHATTISSGPSVFYDLGNLSQGQQILIGRQDGRTATFIVDVIQSYDKANFPDQEVYGQADYPSLRLITCGGDWDETTGQYNRNVVVYASIKR